MLEWHEQDDWWQHAEEIMFTERAWEAALKWAGFEPPIDVLDLPCGMGRHSLEFARRGCRVTGVDRTPRYLEKARQQAAKKGLDITFIQADMRDFRCEQAYDLVINLYTSFGYFEDQGDDREVLENFYASLRPGGALVMDMMGKEVLSRVFTPRDWHQLDDGTLVLEDRIITQDGTWATNRWIMIRKDGERIEMPFSHRIYGASDLKRVLYDAGFESVTVYGDLESAPYDHQARRLYAVARKAGG